MTQRIFDIENEKDMADLWNILPHNINIVMRYKDKTYRFFEDGMFIFECSWLRINWHDKEEITRPIQEATEADIGKLCKGWNGEDDAIILLKGMDADGYFVDDHCWCWKHCRRLTKQEIEELC